MLDVRKIRLLETKNNIFYSAGKLLLSAEYVVLDGAKALAVPTKYGQNLVVKSNNNNFISWKSYDYNQALWFACEFSVTNFELLNYTNNQKNIALKLIEILKAAKQLNPNFLSLDIGYAIETHLDFNRLWGLGTSSTLINNIANWASVDAHKLLAKTFGGSGYDIACAQHQKPIIYSLKNNVPHAAIIDFNPKFKNHLYFVYLNQKQDSRAGITAYKTLDKVNAKTITTISKITAAMCNCATLQAFQNLMEQHEQYISNLINQKPIKQRLFNDFNGSIKSLGAWGGDFVLVASEENPKDYFKTKGFQTIISYSNMI